TYSNASNPYRTFESIGNQHHRNKHHRETSTPSLRRNSKACRNFPPIRPRILHSQPEPNVTLAWASTPAKAKIDLDFKAMKIRSLPATMYKTRARVRDIARRRSTTWVKRAIIVVTS